MKKLLLICFLSFVSLVTAQSIGRVGTTSAAFLKIGVGARGLAMGEANTTIAEDITGMYWNPAGIANSREMQFFFTHYDYIAELTYDYAGMTIPVSGFGTIGIFAGNLGMPDIERTTVQSPNGTGEKVSAGSFVLGLSYGRSLTDRFSIGGNVKYVTESIWHTSSHGFAFDVGVLYKTIFKNIRLGMSISNFGTSMQLSGRDLLIQHDIDELLEGNNENLNANLETEKYPMPILFRVGISSNILEDFFEMTDYDFTFAVDAIHPNDDKEYVNTGAEFMFQDMVALRAGYRKLFLDDSEGGLTFGVGLQFNVMELKINLDYANIDFGRLDHQNKFSLIVAF